MSRKATDTRIDTATEQHPVHYMYVEQTVGCTVNTGGSKSRASRGIHHHHYDIDVCTLKF